MQPSIEQFLRDHDELITRQQALTGMSQAEINARLGRHWQVVLPGVYAAFTGALSPRHLARAAILHAGGQSMLSDVSALRLHRIGYLPADPFVRVLVPSDVQRSSREFVVVRRTDYLPRPFTIQSLPVAPLPRALREFCVRHPDERESLAVAADAVQRGRLALGDLRAELAHSAHRGRRRLVRIVDELCAGVRSAPEADFRRLVLSSKTLPEPLWNPLIQLQDGEVISPDALFVECAVIHETNGRQFHAGEDQFESMQRRHDAAVVAGFAALHNSPRRIRTEGAQVLREVEQVCSARSNIGLPPGVRILRASA